MTFQNVSDHWTEIKEVIKYVPKSKYFATVTLLTLLFLPIVFRAQLIDVIYYYVNRALKKQCSETRQKRSTANSNTNAYHLGPARTNSFWRGMCIYFSYAFINDFLVLAHFICLCFSIGQAIIEGPNLTKSWRMVIFLTICALHVAYKYAKENEVPFAAEIASNRRLVKKLSSSGEQVSVVQESLRVGDLVVLQRGDVVPADCVLLTCPYFNSTLMMDEVQLDGEPVKKRKVGAIVAAAENYQDLQAWIRRVSMQKHSSPQPTYEHIHCLMADTTVVSGRGAVAMVVTIGNDCVMRRSQWAWRRPTPLQSNLEAVFTFNLYVLVLCSGLLALIIHSNFDEAPPLWSCFLQVAVFLNTIIPYSHRFYSRDSAERLAKRVAEKHGVSISSKGVMAIQSMPNCIVSDKTGTLTTNVTELLRTYTWSNFKGKVGCIENNDETVVENVMACTGIVLDDEGEPLNTDAIDFHLLTATKARILRNDLETGVVSYDDHGASMTMTTLVRKFYKEFDRSIDVKCAIVEKQDGKYQLYCQGIPESIVAYARTSPTLASSLLSGITTKIYADFGQFPQNSYRRKIGAGSRQMTAVEVKEFFDQWRVCDTAQHKSELIRTRLLAGLTDIFIYVFEDKLKAGVDRAVERCLDEKCDFSMLTGDAYDSSREVAYALNLLKAPGIHLEKKEHLHSQHFSRYRRVLAYSFMRVWRWRSSRKVTMMSAKGLQTS